MNNIALSTWIRNFRTLKDIRAKPLPPTDETQIREFFVWICQNKKTDFFPGNHSLTPWLKEFLNRRNPRDLSENTGEEELVSHLRFLAGLP